MLLATAAVPALGQVLKVEVTQIKGWMLIFGASLVPPCCLGRQCAWENA
tara:strand:+ start:1736 stop:1882 length:147 start_codon:yes stop_codon:yes gene_type:complete